MQHTKICIMALCTLPVSLAFSGVVYSTPEETVSFYSLDYGGLKINISAPVQAYPGENITVTISAEPITQIYVKYIRITIYGALNATDKITLHEITHLENSDFTSSYEFDYTVAISDNISPGLIYGLISCEWELMGSPQKIPQSGFALTYIRNIELEQLQTEYQQLNATHQSLMEEYEELESGFSDDLDSTRNLLYIFIATTVVASITVIVLLMRKNKKIWI